MKLQRCFLCRSILKKDEIKQPDEWGDLYCKDCETNRKDWIEQYHQNLSMFKKVKP